MIPSDLKLYVENDNEGVIPNDVGTKIKFRVDNAQGVVQNVMAPIEDRGVMPDLK